MPNVTFNNIVSASGGTGNFIASVISTNYNNVATIMNSGGLDSDNYGVSAIKSSNIVHNAIAGVSHMADNAIVSAKIKDSTMRNREFHFGGLAGEAVVRIVQLGAGADNNKHHRISAVYTSPGSSTSLTPALQFSDALDWGATDSPFTETPVIAAAPALQMGVGGTASNRPVNIALTTMNSVSADIVVALSGTQAASFSYTVNVDVWGK